MVGWQVPRSCYFWSGKRHLKVFILMAFHCIAMSLAFGILKGLL